MTFAQYAVCMHCGVALDVFAHDATDEADCYDVYGALVGFHDYDSEYPMGVFEDGTPI